MIVIENPSAPLNQGERAFIAHQRGKRGVLLAGFTVGGGKRHAGREIDAILLTPRGAYAVEVKHTQAVGELDSPANDSWTVGSVSNPFTAHAPPPHRTTARTPTPTASTAVAIRPVNPAAQVDLAAKILATALDHGSWTKPYVTPVVAIHGKVSIEEKVRWVGKVGVATIEHFDLIVRETKSRTLRADDVAAILERLGVARSRVPSLDRLAAEGFLMGGASPSTESPTDEEVPAATRAQPHRPHGQPRPPVPRAMPPSKSHQPVAATRSAPWLLRPYAKTRGNTARIVMSAVVTTVVAVWQLDTGSIFRGIFGESAGERLFVYNSVEPSHSAWSVVQFLIVALGLCGMFGFAAWLRARIGSFTRAESVMYLVSIFCGVVASPAMFASSRWSGAFIAWLVYCFAWPVIAVACRELWAPFSRGFDRAWREYEI